MKLIAMMMAALGTTIAFADPGNYTGTGSWNQNGKDIPYTETFSVTQVGSSQDYNTVEDVSWTDEKGTVQKYHVEFVMQFTSGHNLNITIGGQVVGSGYWYTLGANHWLDLHYTYNNFRVHVNNYYAAAEKTLYRLGDLNDGQQSFIETLKMN